LKQGNGTWGWDGGGSLTLSPFVVNGTRGPGKAARNKNGKWAILGGHRGLLSERYRDRDRGNVGVGQRGVESNPKSPSCTGKIRDLEGGGPLGQRGRAKKSRKTARKPREKNRVSFIRKGFLLMFQETKQGMSLGR